MKRWLKSHRRPARGVREYLDRLVALDLVREDCSS
jgi:hypothetical protein